MATVKEGTTREGYIRKVIPMRIRFKEGECFMGDRQTPSILTDGPCCAEVVGSVDDLCDVINFRVFEKDA